CHPKLHVTLSLSKGRRNAMHSHTKTLQYPQSAPLGIPLGFLIISLALHLLIRSVPSHIAIDLAQPIPVVTSWGLYGVTAWIFLTAGIAIAGVSYFVTLRTLDATNL